MTATRYVLVGLRNTANKFITHIGQGDVANFFTGKVYHALIECYKGIRNIFQRGLKILSPKYTPTAYIIEMNPLSREVAKKVTLRGILR